VLRRSETGLGIDWPDLMGSAWILPPPGVPTRAALDQHIISLGWPPPANVIEVGTIFRIPGFLPFLDAVTVVRRGFGELMVADRLAAPLGLSVPGSELPVGLTWRRQPQGGPSTIGTTARLFRMTLLQRHELTSEEPMPPGWAAMIARLEQEDAATLATTESGED
jgi:hypothetical protein